MVDRVGAPLAQRRLATMQMMEAMLVDQVCRASIHLVFAAAVDRQEAEWAALDLEFALDGECATQPSAGLRDLQCGCPRPGLHRYSALRRGPESPKSCPAATRAQAADSDICPPAAAVPPVLDGLRDRRMS